MASGWLLRVTAVNPAAGGMDSRTTSRQPAATATISSEVHTRSPKATAGPLREQGEHVQMGDSGDQQLGGMAGSQEIEHGGGVGAGSVECVFRRHRVSSSEQTSNVFVLG